MASTVRALLGLRSRSESQDVDFPRTTKQIQEMVDWQNLLNHLDEAETPQKKTYDSTASSTKREMNQPGWSSLSTDQLEKELLARKFHAAHTEIGRRAAELQGVAVQVGMADGNVECQQALQIYTHLMKDATELLGALANKMSRLRNKIDLSTALVHTRRPQSRGRTSPATQTTDSISRSGSTQHRSWLQPKAPENAPSHQPSYRRAASSRQNPTNSMLGQAKLHPNNSIASSASKNAGNTTCVHEPRSQQPVTYREADKAKTASELQAKTLGDLPTLKPDELLRLEQPNTEPDLPRLNLDEQ